jgi:hypothetical protein
VLGRLLRLRPATALGLEAAVALAVALTLPLAFVGRLYLQIDPYVRMTNWPRLLLGYLGIAGPIALALWAGSLMRWRWPVRRETRIASVG